MIAGKFDLTVPSVSFCGFIISRYGAVANLEKVRAIAEFHTPGNIIDPRCFFMVGKKLAEFSPDIASTADGLRFLISPKTA